MIDALSPNEFNKENEGTIEIKDKKPEVVKCRPSKTIMRQLAQQGILPMDDKDNSFYYHGDDNQAYNYGDIKDNDGYYVYSDYGYVWVPSIQFPDHQLHYFSNECYSTAYYWHPMYCVPTNYVQMEDTEDFVSN